MDSPVSQRSSSKRADPDPVRARANIRPPLTNARFFWERSYCAVVAVVLPLVGWKLHCPGAAMSGGTGGENSTLLGPKLLCRGRRLAAKHTRLEVNPVG